MVTGEMSADGDAILATLAERSIGDEGAFRPFGSLASARQYSLLYELWGRHVPAGAEVLDWGAGNGHFGYFLQTHGHRATAFTFGSLEVMDWIGRPYHRIEFGSPADPVGLPFAESSFDAVASIGVLEHVRETGGNEPGSMAEIARVLRPGGVFVCYHLPSRWSWIEPLAKRVAGKHHHRFRFAEADIRRLVDDAGMELVGLRRYGLLPRNGLRLLPARLRRSWALANVWDGIDAVLALPLGVISQNYAFVARKPLS
jgi:SAM-dependent methyltransferase